MSKYILSIFVLLHAISFFVTASNLRSSSTISHDGISVINKNSESFNLRGIQSRKLSNRVQTIIAGTGNPFLPGNEVFENVNTDPLEASFTIPQGIAVDKRSGLNCNVYFIDTANCVRKIDISSGTISIFAGLVGMVKQYILLIYFT